MADSEIHCSVNKCNYCGKKVDLNGSKYVKCESCVNVFHFSCSQRKANKIVDLAKHSIVCYACNEGAVDLDSDFQESSEVTFLMREVTLLKCLLDEKDARISELIKVNTLLEDMLNYIQYNKGVSTVSNKGARKTSTDKNLISHSGPYYDNTGKQTSYVDKVRMSDSSIDKLSGISSAPKQGEDNDHLKEHVNKQLQVMNEIINLDNDGTAVGNRADHKSVTRKKHMNANSKGTARTVGGPGSCGAEIRARKLISDASDSNTMRTQEEAVTDLSDIDGAPTSRGRIGSSTDGGGDNANAGFTTATSKRGRTRDPRRKIVTGAKAVNECSIRAADQMCFLHVYKLHIDTTVANLQDYLKVQFPEAKVEELKSAHPELYTSFKITVYKKNMGAAMDPGMWPEGVKINRFFHRRMGMMMGT